MITLRDIAISARQESYRMRHFYLGTEHWMIALLEIKGGLASSMMQDHGLPPEYIIDAIRRKVGKGSRHRLWAGVPNTPRTDVVLSIANELALEDGRAEISERDLLVAILEESDNMPARVLRAFGLNVVELAKAARIRPLNPEINYAFVKIDFAPEFDRNMGISDDQLFILRRMFHGYGQVLVERRLTGGYTKALILVATPITTDGTKHASVVVKIDQQDTILDEAQRYEQHIKGTLPPLTARMEDRPVAPDVSEYAGIKYTFITGGNKMSQDLRQMVSMLGSAKLGEWLRRELYGVFGAMWWQQRKPYRFQMWREYDRLLPPILTLEFIDEKDPISTTPVIKPPVKRQRVQQLEYGDVVAIENFIVHRVYRDRNAIQIATGYANEPASAYKIEIRGIDLKKDAYYRGEVIERIAGRVYKTRTEELRLAVRGLEADFDVHAQFVRGGDGPLEKLPNPLLGYDDLLERYINGSLSKIHGDLHLGNILVGTNDSASLIDFGQARDGHTLFDWATLEISILSDVVMVAAGGTWDNARAVLRYIHALNHNQPMPTQQPKIAEAMAAVVTIREIVRELLNPDESWAEYYAALMLCALRAVTWADTMHPGGRRLMFLVAALSLWQFQPKGNGMTPSPDDTEAGDLSKSM
jgi:hypothetical protein